VQRSQSNCEQARTSIERPVDIDAEPTPIARPLPLRQSLCDHRTIECLSAASRVPEMAPGVLRLQCGSRPTFVFRTCGREIAQQRI
jgi:hypothetical protein